MKVRAAVVVWLVGLWLLLWRDVSVANVASGVAVAVAVATAFPVVDPGPSVGPRGVRPVALAHVVVYFVWELLKSNLVLGREVLTVADTTRPGVMAFELEPASDLVVTIIANAVSLTPGTLTLEVGSDPPTLYVHVLHLHDFDRARAAIRRLEVLVRRAFGYDADAGASVRAGAGGGGVGR